MDTRCLDSYIYLWLYSGAYSLGKEVDTESAGIDEDPPFYDDEREYDVKKQELDELFGRLDERTSNTWTLVEKMEKHLDKLNNSVLENTVACAKSRTNYRNIWTVIGLIVVAVAAALGLGIAL